MTKLKLPSWNTVGKDLVVKTGDVVVILKASTSLFARLLIIARSSRESLDLQDVVGVHELSNTNRTLFQINGMIHPTTDKSSVISLVEDLGKSCEDIASDSQLELRVESADVQSEPKTCLIVDGMALVQELVSVKKIQ